jgi:integrase
MASVFKRGDSKFYVACFVDRNGRQMKRSTKTADRNQALRIAQEIEDVERKAKAGALTTAQLHKVLNDVSEKVTGDTLSVPSVEEYLQGWLEGIKAKRAKGTFERYSNTARRFIAHLGPRAKRPVNAVSPADIEGFLNARLNSGMAPKTTIVDVKTLKSAFRRAELFGILTRNPVTAVQLPRDVSSERGVFTMDEVQLMIGAAPNLDWQTLLLLGFFIGARLGDCAKMKWENVHPEDGVIVFEQTKTQKKLIIPMHFHIIEHLNYLRTFGTTGYLCPSLATKRPGGKNGLSEGFKRIALSAGLDLLTVQGKGRRMFNRRTFHSLRYSFNSLLANAGVSDELRMKLTGHSTKAMNHHYTRFEVATLRNAVTAMPMFTKK